MAQYKFTVLLMPNGPHKITGLPFDEALVKSEKSLEDVEILVSFLLFNIIAYLLSAETAENIRQP